MSAKEMFKELGFKLCRTSKDGISYSQYEKTVKEIRKSYSPYEREQIYFDKEYRAVKFKNKDYLLQEELQAINQQVKELGWYE